MTSATSTGFGRRFAAFLYDALLVAALLLVYTAAALLFTRGRAITAAGTGGGWYVYRAGEVLVVGGYSVLNWVRSGQTLGMRAWRIHAVSASGHPLKTAQACWRFIWAVAAWTPAGLGVLWLYADPERLALQDRLSHTRVVHLART